MSGLVGQSHQAALAELLAVYRRVSAGVATPNAGGVVASELVVLRAPMGWGKTRVVQEFYARLAAGQPDGAAYWPAALLESPDSATVLDVRKRIIPKGFRVGPEVDLPFLWWGVSCQPRQDGRLANAVADDVSQLVTHLGPALNRLESRNATRQAALALARTLSAASPFSDVPGILDGLDNLRTGIKDLFRGLAGQRLCEGERQTANGRLEGNDSLVEKWVGALGQTLSSTAAPLVAIVDDAHWADRATIEFLDELLKRVPTVLVFTAWPDQLDLQMNNEDEHDAGSFMRRWLDRLTTIDLDLLGISPMQEIAGTALGIDPGCDLSRQLANRAGGNPFLLRLWTEVPKVRRSARSGLSLDVAELAALPNDAVAAYQERWQKLPQDLQTVLTAAADLGISFVPQVVAEAIEASVLLNEIDPPAALNAAADPHRWVRAILPDLSLFAEPVLHQIAVDRISEILTASERKALHIQFNSSVCRLKQSDLWNEFSASAQRSLLTSHIEVSGRHHLSIEDALADSYLRLADLQPESLVGWTAALALVEVVRCAPRGDHSRGSRSETALDRAARLLFKLGRASEALPLFQQTLSDRESILGQDHPDTLTSRNNLASCLETVGRASEALTLFQQTLSDRESILGQDHPDTLTSRNDVAHCLETVGRASEALTLFQQELTHSNQVLGPDHPATLTRRNNLAYCLESVGRASEALPLYQQTLSDRERILGQDHPDTLDSRNNLGVCLLGLGRASEALTLFQQELARSNQILGPDHPATLTRRTNLASCLVSVGRAAEALPLYQQTLSDRERILGQDHPATLDSRNNLAASLFSGGRYDEALELLELAHFHTEKMKGAAHRSTLTVRANLAGCLHALDRPEDAVSLLERALADTDSALGPDHPDVLFASSTLGCYLHDVGRSEEAIALQEQAFTVSERVLGPDHPDTLDAGYYFAASLDRVGRPNEALAIHQRIFSISQRVLGPDHTDTLARQFSLASCLQAAGRQDDALPLLQIGYLAAHRIYGGNHRDVLTTRNNLAICLQAVGRAEEALPLNESALADSERTLGPRHPDTLIARYNLAKCLEKVGRSADALPHLERTLAEAREMYPIDHPTTQTFETSRNRCLKRLSILEIAPPSEPRL